ncbi:VUT family protein [Embleya sp. NBC_00896]|uniref:VUT family protein n=1 Tax=Embleya sp. NBC_00896 TaxID=2975961 RepID=UPI003866AFF2|nr:VUT family protein [Embleya sp. NBC_00896]
MDHQPAPIHRPEPHRLSTRLVGLRALRNRWAFDLRTAALCLTYAGTIPAANWVIQQHGAVEVWPGIHASAGVYFAGLAFTLRDLVHERGGATAVFVALGFGTVLSLLFADPRVAVAAATSFAVSEVADTAVYAALRHRGRLVAVGGSNLVGTVVDSVLFLSMAFGDLALLPGQMIGKVWATAAALCVLSGGRYAARRGGTAG